MLVKIYHMKFTRYPEILQFPQDFELVAVVESEDFPTVIESLEEAYTFSQNEYVGKLNVRSRLIQVAEKRRSSMVGDIFEVWKGCDRLAYIGNYVVDRIGFRNTKTKELLGEDMGVMQ